MVTEAPHSSGTPTAASLNVIPPSQAGLAEHACGGHHCGGHQSTHAPSIWLFAEPAGALLLLLSGLLVDWSATPGGIGTWIAVLLLATSMVLAGRECLHTSWSELRRGRMSIDLLMLIAAVGASAIGHWEDGALLLFLFSLSHALEAFILGRTRQAISNLVNFTPEVVTRFNHGTEERIATTALEIGDIVIVHPGERVPVDGVIEEGESMVDESPVTGESVPIEKYLGDKLYAGSLNQSGRLILRMTKAPGESTLARLVKLVEETETRSTRSQSWAKRLGQSYSLGVIALSLAVFVFVWVTRHEVQVALIQAMTVLVALSPCALVLAVPAATLASIAGAARQGIFFKGGMALEQTASLKCFAFDKTGTLTLGRPALRDFCTAEGVTEHTLFSLAASIESQSEHPLARAVAQAAQQRKISWEPARELQASIANGISGMVGTEKVLVGKWAWVRGLVSTVDEKLRQSVEQWQGQGWSVIGVVSGSPPVLIGTLAVADTLRPSAAPALEELRALGLSPLTMLTGDHPVVAAQVAKVLNLRVAAGLLPEEKLELLQQLRREHGPVGMMGDGLNDAPALAAADVGFSLGGAATDVAIETADVIVLADDLCRLPTAIRIARRAQQIMAQNFVVALGTMAALLVATGVTTLPLPIAVIGHEGSTVLVILNSVRMLWGVRSQWGSAGPAAIVHPDQRP